MLKRIIIISILMSITSFVIGILLGMIESIFNVKVNKKELLIRNILPGNNCGCCGYAGCNDYAFAIVNKNANITSCCVKNNNIIKNIAKIMKKKIKHISRMVAFVKCLGNCNNIKLLYNYNGIFNCKIISDNNNSFKSCEFGCLGCGDCVKICSFNAINIINGIAFIDKKLCNGCGKCINVCPKNIIELIPNNKKYIIACNSKENNVMNIIKNCKIGCITCKKCMKICPNKAINIKNNLMYINYKICINCGKCMKICPRKIIYYQK